MQIVKLNLIPGGVLPVCFASQHDTGRVIRFMLFEGENVFTLSGAETIALRLQKPDSSELVESVTNTGADYVDVVTTADTCDTAGASVGEIVITDGGDVLGSANFGLFVESDAFESGGIVTQTASGAIATFETNIETAFVSLKSDINPVQSGSGTPSPSNVRPISGFSALNVTLADGEMQTVETKTVNFGQTVYKGVADVTNGKVSVTHGFVDLGTLNYNYNGTFFYADIPSDSGAVKTGGIDAICSIYPEHRASASTQPDKSFAANNNSYGGSKAIFIKDSAYSDAQTFKNSLDGVQLVYELATPIEITTTPENLTAIVGQTNNVYSDTNGDTEVKYYIEV